MFYQRLIGSLVLALAVLTASGCASIFSGTTQQMTFQSTPEGATVTISGRVIGKTPITTTLKKEKNQSVVFTLDGHKPITMQLTTQLDNWFWGNIVLGGVIGSTTDGITGAVHHYSPSQYYVTLTPDGKGVDGKTSRSRDHQIRDLVVFRHDALLREFRTDRRTGETFSSLAALLAVDEAAKESAWTRVQAISRQHDDPVRFADALIQQYPRNK